MSVLIKNKYRVALFAIVLAGSFLYFTGADWGLPVNLHPDEQTIAETARRMTANNTFKPDVFMRPDHLLIIINALIYRVILLIKGVPAESIAELPAHIFYLTARIVTGFFAVGSILISYLVGKKNNRFTGLICAVLFAFFPIFITHAHYATPDIPTVFFMLLFIYFAISYMQDSSYKNLICMALATALFITVKYPGAILCLMIAITIIIKSIAQKYTAASSLKNSEIVLEIIARGVFSVVLIFLFIFIVSPALILEYNAVYKAILQEARDTHLGADGLGWDGNMRFYIDDYWGACSALMRLFFVIGCFAVIVKIRKSYVFIPVLYCIIYFICLSYLPLHHARWGLPMYVTPLLITAFGIDMTYRAVTGDKARMLFGKLTGKLAGKIQVPDGVCAAMQKVLAGCFCFILCILSLNLITSALRQTVLFTIPDTRVLSIEYVKENGITASNTAFEGYTTFYPHGGGGAYI